jgi:hypothetical protein
VEGGLVKDYSEGEVSLIGDFEWDGMDFFEI